MSNRSMHPLLLRLAAALLWVGLGVAAAQPQPLLTEKKLFTMPSYTTVGGKTINRIRIGYETYGTLNAKGDNAIFIAHFFSGNSHAAGRYKPDDKTAGYWDAIVGPGKAIDTDKYFVISADVLANLNTKDPNTITTGPASIDPDTGKPYGMTFPVVTPRDFVRVHKPLVDSLGVKKLRAVAGASGGAIQAMEWAALYPDFVERVVCVIGPGFDIHPYVIGLLDLWHQPIMLDPKWNGGDYYGREEPVDGLALALKAVTLTALAPGWAEKAHGYKPAAEGKNPLDAVSNLYSIQAGLNTSGQARAKTTDANSVIYTSKAYQLYNLGDDVKRIKAKVLFVPAKTDLIFPPELSRRAMERLKAQGNTVELFEIEGTNGHLDGILSIGKAADAIRAFLDK
jgi:homoserine O-acetyltransferase